MSKKDHDFYRCLNKKECEYCTYKPKDINICNEPEYNCNFLWPKNEECLQCDRKDNLTKIIKTNSQYDGLYICEGCLDENESRMCGDC